MLEIERKFIFNGDLAEMVRSDEAKLYQKIEQVYLLDTGAWAIRGRMVIEDGDTSFLMTMKRSKSIMTSVEIEYPITPMVYDELCQQCGHTPIQKVRYSVRATDDLVFTIDQFLNPELDRLHLVEIELPAEDTEFPRPAWLGDEVTHLPEYRNSHMVQRLRSHN